MNSLEGEIYSVALFYINVGRYLGGEMGVKLNTNVKPRYEQQGWPIEMKKIVFPNKIKWILLPIKWSDFFKGLL